jgi:hypothetical protein
MNGGALLAPRCLILDSGYWIVKEDLNFLSSIEDRGSSINFKYLATMKVFENNGSDFNKVSKERVNGFFH